MKKIALMGAMLCCIYTAIAQKTIKGKITDKTSNTPLFGATIKYNGGGTQSDKNGEFTLPCGIAKKITVSFIGYESYSIDIQDCKDLTINLSSSGVFLDDVEIFTSSERKNQLYQPVSITKLTAVELKRGQGVFFDDAVQTSVPGVQMNRRSVSGGQQFNIRGYGNGSRGTRGISSNFDGQGYKVYLNNIPVTDAEGITTLDDIDYASVNNAEFVKGPAGTLYGQAIAGAINLKIASAEKGKSSISQQTMVGNYGLQRFTTILQTATERSGILLAYGKQKSDGFSNHNSSHKDFVNFVGEFQPNEKQNISTFVGYTNSYDERLGELTIAQWNTNDYSGNVDYLKRNAHSHVSTFRAGVSHSYNFNQTISNTTSLFGTGFRSDVSSAGGWTDKTSVNYGLRTSFGAKFKIGESSSLNGVTGLEVQRQDAHVIGYNMKQSPYDTTTTSTWALGRPYWIVNSVTSNNAFVTTPTAYFTEWTLALPKDLSFTAGIGLSTQRIVLDDRFNSPNVTITRPAHFDTSYKSMWSPHLAVNKVFHKSVSVYGSYSVGYKAPVSSYFFVTTPQIGTGNPPAAVAKAYINNQLKPEKGVQFEIGSKGSALNDRLFYQLALFHLKYKNKMTAITVPVPANPVTATAYSYMVNGSDQDNKGIELLAKYSIVKEAKGFITNLTPFVNFTYSDFKYGDNFVLYSGTTTANGGIDTLNYSGLSVFGVPKVMYSIGIDLASKPGIYFSLSFLHKDSQSIGFERKTQNPESYVLHRAASFDLLNTKIGFRKNLSARFNMDAFFGINNITGNKYPIMIFINQIPDAYIPAPPKAVVFGGINLKFYLNK